ncbi:flagellar hook-length control protein FliK [Azospirillum rugosum]|uniref:Flagellar hook-length control protein-like C-terminal domain-containing protein n=1 Tax=Azospirillum rugosum TaxID=416170 RepID=A0ABS4STZ0_9PROT|nr:flagellar hook-length control protein FliK [Azospirillum rugosum]MBP2296008.1 hypothetical protein [Azospirillum rugosum]MDQ0529598.1 hypothetical protein [Azospirillum rugosum]
MPALPDAIAAPPPRPVRPAEAPRGEEDTAPGTPFADLLDEADPVDDAAADDETKPPKGGAPANADAALAALLPFLAPPPPQAPAAAITGPGLTAPPQGDGAAIPVDEAVALATLASAAKAEATTGAALPKGSDAVLAAAVTPPTGSEPQGDAVPLPAVTLAEAIPMDAAPVPVVSGTPAKPTDKPLPKPADATPTAAAPDAGAPDTSAPVTASAAPSAGNSGNNGPGNNGAGANGSGQRPSPAPEVVSAAQAHADAVPPPTVATVPAHAAAHYAASPADGAQAPRLPAAQLAQPLVRVVEAGGGEFRIDLAPDDLGPVRVVAELHAGRVALTIQAEQADTLSMLRRDIHHLERALNDAGFELDGGTLQFSLRGDNQPRGFASPRQEFEGQGGARPAWREDAAPAVPAERRAVLLDGLVDISV